MYQSAPPARRLRLALALSAAAFLALPLAGAQTVAAQAAGPARVDETFDAGLSGWRSYRARLTLVLRGHSGRAARVTLHRSVSPGATFSIFRWPRVTASPGAELEARAWVRAAERGRRLCLVVREEVDGRTAGRRSHCLRSSGRWQRFDAVRYAPRSGGRVGVTVAQHGGLRGSSFVVDSVTLSESPVAAASPAAGNVPPPAFGVHVHALWGTYTNEQRIAVLDRLAASGARWLRIDVSWCSFQGASTDDVNEYWVDLLDFVVDAARARGLSVLGNTICTPAWATDCPACNWEQASPRVPRNPAMFGRFMEFLAGHYRGRIAAWELWNEPNESNHQFWQGDARQYVDLVLRPGFEAVKRVDPSATVVAAGTSYVDRAWIESVYDAGGGAFFDALAVHPYMAPWNLPPETDNGTRWTITHIDSAREAMIEHGDADKPIWFTEFGWSSSYPTYAQGVTEAQQAEYAVRALELVRTRYPYVRNVFWYNDRDRGSGNAREDAFGLLRSDLSPKPVYESLKNYLTGG